MRGGGDVLIEEVQSLLNVSRETLQTLNHYVELLERWQTSIDLVSSQSLEHVWRRHILDCAQLYAHIPAAAQSVTDMGSGAGLPGLIVAILARPERALHTVLIESNGKKCGFLRFAAAELGLEVEVIRARLDVPTLPPADVVTARALAPLPDLLTYAQRFKHDGMAKRKTLCLFLKGQDVEGELTKTTKYWKLDVQRIPSLSDPSGTLLVIEDFNPC